MTIFEGDWEGPKNERPSPKNKKSEKMPTVNKEIVAMLKGSQSKDSAERIQYNIKKALAMDAEISYKDTDDGKISVTVVKDGKETVSIFDSLDNEVKIGITKAMELRGKKRSKEEAKNSVKYRYKVGDRVVLRGKIRDGSERIVKKFEVVKVIWSIRSKPVNILILRQYEGPNNNRSLDKNDCKKYHIKYEPGLQVYSMMLNFSKIRKNNQKMIELS